MKAAKVVFVICCFLAVVACARQYRHAIRVVHHDDQDFIGSDCKAFTTVVHAIAGKFRLQETQGVSDRESFPRYRSYWSQTSPLSLDLYCDSNMLQVTVTAVRADQS